MQKIIELFIGLVVYVLIFRYLIPLLPAPFDLIITIFLVVIAVVWVAGEATSQYIHNK